MTRASEHDTICTILFLGKFLNIIFLAYFKRRLFYAENGV